MFIRFSKGDFYEPYKRTYPKTLDAGMIQEDSDNGWEESINEVWFDITETCNLKPFI